MTNNQINYQKHLEDIRSHKASEENARRQAEAAQISANAAAVNAGVNQGRLLLDTQRLEIETQLESTREQHDYELRSAGLAEQVRHNQTSEANDVLISSARNASNEEIAAMNRASSEGVAAAERDLKDKLNLRDNWFGVGTTVLTNVNKTKNNVITQLANIATSVLRGGSAQKGS